METNAPKKLFFYELCRLCLENEGACDIFETTNLLEDIYNCTGVKMSSSDNLPHKICIKCSEVVASSKELRFLASKNDAHLRSLFGGVQDYDDSDGDIIQTLHSTQKTSSIPKLACPEVKSTCNSPNQKNQNSSKEKLNLLLIEGEENGTGVTPVIRQTISLRKDLFSPSSQTMSPIKARVEDDPAHRLLTVKVEAENTRNKIKIRDEEDEDTEYICGTCCKAFDKYKKLYLHQRLHNKRIHCPLDACGKKFATKGDLDKHLRTHTGEKPFLCKICDRGFTQRVSLRAHVTTVHGKDVKEPKVESEIENGATISQKSPTR